MDFEDKVKSLSFKQILGFLIEGLENPEYPVNMAVFAMIINGVCFGCAALNAITKLYGKPFPLNKFYNRFMRSSYLDCSYDFYFDVENAYDSLRAGNVQKYNLIASRIGIALCPVDIELPFLRTTDYLVGLDEYKEFYDSLPD